MNPPQCPAGHGCKWQVDGTFHPWWHTDALPYLLGFALTLLTILILAYSKWKFDHDQKMALADARLEDAKRNDEKVRDKVLRVDDTAEMGPLH